MMMKGNPSKRILVHNLSPTTNNDTLRRIFGKYGNIESVHIPTSTNSRGQIYGFVEFSTVQQAQAAFDILNNTSIDGSVLHFQFVEAKEIPGKSRRDQPGGAQRVVPTPAPLQAATPLNPNMEMTRYNTTAGGEFTIDSTGRLTRRSYLEEEQRTGRARSPASQNPLLIQSAITIASAEKPENDPSKSETRTGVLAITRQVVGTDPLFPRIFPSNQMRVSQPVGQKRHTNIAVVSIRKRVEGKDYKFEIACYPNKVLNQREGLEKDLDQVLQTDTIFTNVSRGDIATNEDLITCFGTTNHRKICIEIIKEGHLQVSEKEREYLSESRNRDVLNMLTQMTMDASTGYPLTVTQIQAALDDIHYHISSKSSLKGSRSIKHRDEEEEVKLIARECVKKLETELPHRISRVNMMLKVVVADHAKAKITTSSISNIAEGKCIVTNEDHRTFLVTCHPRVMKLIKDTYGDDIETLSVVDSFVHKILPNSVPPSPPKKLVSQSSADPSPKVVVTEQHNAGHAKTSSHNHACVTCGDTAFESATEFRQHCRSEWHAFNKKRQVKGLPFMDHLEYELLPDEMKLNFNAVDP